MKITIDTKEDTHEDIRKVIKMLQHLVGEQSYTNQPNIFEDTDSPSTDSSNDVSSSAPEGNAFVNMFGDTQTTDEPKEEPMDEPEEEKKEEKEDIPEVVPY